MTKEISSSEAKLEGRLAEKFLELKDFMKERSGKRGKANTIRFATKLAYEKMKELKRKKKELVKGYKRYERKLNRLVEK